MEGKRGRDFRKNYKGHMDKTKGVKMRGVGGDDWAGEEWWEGMETTVLERKLKNWPLWKTVWNFLRKLKMELLFDPVIPLLGLYPKSPKTPIQKNLCTPMFIAAQFTITKCRKQPKCPPVNEWIKNYGTFTQWNTTQQKERRSSYPSRQHGWIWRALC